MIMLRNDGLHEATQAPQEDLDYGIDWNPRLESSETIQSSVWECPEPDVLTRQGLLANLAVVFVDLPLSLLGKSTTITNTVSTSAGRKYSKSLILFCNIL